MKNLIALRPIMSEKAYGLSKSRNTYVFDVPMHASKQVIAEAVKQQFSVEVTKVNVSTTKGKAKRTVYRRSRSVTGKRSDSRKAYVTLKGDNQIPIFAAVDEAKDKQATAEKKVKK